MTKLRQRMVEELQRRNYSAATIRGYVLAIKQFADYFGKPPDRLGATHIQRFQWYLLQERKLAPVTVEIRMWALRFFFKKMLKRRDIHFDDLPFPKTPRKLPTVLSREEVGRMIDETTNLMHRTILMVLYGTGVRRTELSLLKVTDIDSKRMVIHIRQGKGSCDRDVPLSPKLLEALREYWRWKKPKIYLFPSTPGKRGVEEPMSDKVVWWAVREAARDRPRERGEAPLPPRLRYERFELRRTMKPTSARPTSAAWVPHRGMPRQPFPLHPGAIPACCRRSTCHTNPPRISRCTARSPRVRAPAA